MALPLSALPGPEALPPSANATPVRHTRNTSIVSRHVAGETIVVPICRGVGDLDSVYTFNSLGQSLWQLLEDARTAEELANWVAMQYEVDAKQASNDVQGYLAELTEIGLIRTI
jgi:Coenzyme PQQ synthesis protein D (PqqD)